MWGETLCAASGVRPVRRKRKLGHEPLKQPLELRPDHHTLTHLAVRQHRPLHPALEHVHVVQLTPPEEGLLHGGVHNRAPPDGTIAYRAGADLAPSQAADIRERRVSCIERAGCGDVEEGCVGESAAAGGGVG